MAARMLCPLLCGTAFSLARVHRPAKGSARACFISRRLIASVCSHRVVQPPLSPHLRAGARGTGLAAEPFLIATDLRKSFNGFQAVDGVSFSIARQEIFGLLGPNGAGKTTTIRMLSTILAPDSGDIIVGGYSVRNDPDKVRRLIGVCPQDLALYQELSAWDNLVFFGRMAGLDSKTAKARAAQILDLVGVADRAKDDVSKFSGGMKPRVNLGIALVSTPQHLFLDEPTVGIDPQSRNHIFETVLSLRDGGLTVLYTTHYMEEADRLCDRIAILDAGTVIATGAPSELKAQVGDPSKVTLEEVFLNLTGRSLRD